MTSPEWFGRLPDGSQRTRRGTIVRDVVLRRGVDTSIGQAGHCEACGADMPDGPDACLGTLPGVSHACCGHGGVTEAYVVIGGQPDEPADLIKGKVVLRGPRARDYFAAAVRS